MKTLTALFFVIYTLTTVSVVEAEVPSTPYTSWGIVTQNRYRLSPGGAPKKNEPWNGILKRALPAFTRCYHQGLESDPTLEGNMILRINVSSTGKVTKTRIERADFRNQPMEACLITVTDSLEFPPGKPITMTYPLYLSRT